MKHKVAHLVDANLDRAVALVLGRRVVPHPTGEPGWWTVYRDNPAAGWDTIRTYPDALDPQDWSPSDKWEHGGPIIEREGITVQCNCSSLGRPYWLWEAYVQAEFDGGTLENCTAQAEGPTPLIAAMRAFVASKFGEEVELP